MQCETPESRFHKGLRILVRNPGQLGWLIDPAEKLVFVYFPDQRMILQKFAVSVKLSGFRERDISDTS